MGGHLVKMYDDVTIECFHVTSFSLTLRRKTENSRNVGVRDSNVYGDLHEMSYILIMLLISVESDKIPLLRKLKQLYKRFFNRYHIYC